MINSSTSSFFKKRPSSIETKQEAGTRGPDSTHGVFMARFVHVGFIPLRDEVLRLPLRAGLSPEEDAVVLLGVHENRLFFRSIILGRSAGVNALKIL